MAGLSQNAKVFYLSWISCYMALQALILCSTCNFSHAQLGSMTENQTASLPEPYVIIANRDAIHRVNLDESGFKIVVNGSSLETNTIAIDFDFRRNYLFWSDVKSKRIVRANLNGSEPEILVDNGLTIADGLAWDWLNEKLYWTDSKQREIEVYDIHTQHRKQLVQTGNGTIPRALVLDPNTRFLYWTDWGDKARIERMSMDGTMRETLHDTDLTWPNGLTIDYNTHTLYWVDAKLDKIESSFMNGSNRQLVTTSFVIHPFSIAFFDGILYWSDWVIRQVIYAPLSSVESVAGLVPVLQNKPMGVRVVAIGTQPITTANPCSESNCSYTCLLSASKNSSFSCQCPEGKTTDDSGTRCISDNTTTSTPPTKGSCRAAGYTNCCIITVEVCEGIGGGVPECFCDAGCVELDDCCDDFFDICPVSNPVSSIAMSTDNAFATPTPVLQVSSSDRSIQTILSSSTNILEVKISHLFMPEESSHSGSIRTSYGLVKAPTSIQTALSSVSVAITPSLDGITTDGQAPLLTAVCVIVFVLLLVLIASSFVLFLIVWRRRQGRRNNAAIASFENFMTEESCKKLDGFSSRSPSFGESMDSGVSEV